jgi:hypothetical protein
LRANTHKLPRTSRVRRLPHDRKLIHAGNHELKAVCGLPRAEGHGGFHRLRRLAGIRSPKRMSRLPHAEFGYMQAFI